MDSSLTANKGLGPRDSSHKRGSNGLALGFLVLAFCRHVLFSTLKLLNWICTWGTCSHHLCLPGLHYMVINILTFTGTDTWRVSAGPKHTLTSATLQTSRCSPKVFCTKLTQINPSWLPENSLLSWSGSPGIQTALSVSTSTTDPWASSKGALHARWMALSSRTVVMHEVRCSRSLLDEAAVAQKVCYYPKIFHILQVEPL